jgi:hypothetical protein
MRHKGRIAAVSFNAYDADMTMLNLILDNANPWANLVVFLLLIALAFRGARRHRRWSLALVGVSIATWTALVTAQRIEMYFGNWDVRIRDPQQAEEIADTTTKLAVVSGGLMCVGLALEIAALMRGLNATGSKDGASDPPPSATGGG